MEVGAHIIVSGMVQGVGFRYFVYNRAIKLGLNGSVKNLFNGDVEIEVEGERSLVEVFIQEVKIGPRAAHVAGVKIEWEKPGKHFHEFRIQ
jgi:acylphosphatase